jgi:lipopolysaccharide export system permease protein
MPIARTLSGYIARQFLVWFGAVFGTMVSIAFLLDYIELMRRAGARAQATWGVLLQMAALKLPYTAQDVMPFAILFGTMFVFWRLTRSNELVAARAAGISAWAFLAPAVLAALLIGIASVTLFNPVASAMQASYQKLENRILRLTGDSTSLANGMLWLRQSDGDGGQVIIHGEKLAERELVLRDAGLFFMNARSQFTARIEAQSARLERGFWVIEQGQRFHPGEPAESFATMRLATHLTSHKIEESLASPESMSFWKLPGYIKLLEESGFSAQRHRLYFNVLLAKPLLFCAMVLIAASFSLRMQRRGGAVALLISGVAAAFLLYFLSDVIFALGLSARIPVLLAAWTPAGVGMIFGVSMLLHLEDG